MALTQHNPFLKKVVDYFPLSNGRSVAPSLALSGIKLEEALATLASLCGIQASIAQLTAGLPIPQGGTLDYRLTPLSLSRIGLQAESVRLDPRILVAENCPALFLLKDKSFVIVHKCQGDILDIISQGGVTKIDKRCLFENTDGTAFIIGHISPQYSELEQEEEKEITKSPKTWIIRQFLSDRSLIFPLCMVGFLLNLCAFSLPIFTRSVYDRVVPNLAIETLWGLSIGVVLALLFEIGLKKIKSVFIDAISIKTGLLVQHRVMNTLLRSKISSAPKQSGAVLSILKDIEALSTLIPTGLVSLAIDIPFFFLFLIVIALIGGWVALSAVIGAMIIVAAGFFSHQSLSKASKNMSELSRTRNNFVVDAIEGLVSIKITRSIGRFLGQWDVLSDHVALNQRHVRHYTDNPSYISAFSMQLVTVGIILIGVYELKEGHITLGGMVASTLLAGRAMVPISNAVQVTMKMLQSLTVFSGLSKILTLETENMQKPGASFPPAIRGTVRCTNVCVQYKESSQPVLNHINFTIQAGERVGIIGKSGSGKSTLLHLLNGLIEPNSGQLTLDNRDIGQFPCDLMRTGIAYAPQEALLFEGSLIDNLQLHGGQISPERLERLLTAVGLEHFIKTQPQGVNMAVGTRGTRLSGGQKQCVLLARALAQDTPIIILDEPTAAMDVGTELSVMRGLAAISAGKTFILATHRMSLLEIVDRVIWMEDGRIVADLPKAEMLALFQEQQKKSSRTTL